MCLGARTWSGNLLSKGCLERAVIIHEIMKYFLGVVLLLCRSFRARHDCCKRSYDYLLPAAIIGIHPDTDTSEVEQRVTKFQSLLHLFEVFSLGIPQLILSCRFIFGYLVLKLPFSAGEQVKLELKIV